MMMGVMTASISVCTLLYSVCTLLASKKKPPATLFTAFSSTVNCAFFTAGSMVEA